MSLSKRKLSHLEVDDPVRDSATQITSLVGDSSCMRVNVTSHSNNDYMQIDDSLQVNHVVEVDRVTELNMVTKHKLKKSVMCNSLIMVQ